MGAPVLSVMAQEILLTLLTDRDFLVNMLVTEAGHKVFTWHRDDGGCFVAYWDDSGTQRDSEDISENICQLVCTSNWALRLVRWPVTSAMARQSTWFLMEVWTFSLPCCSVLQTICRSDLAHLERRPHNSWHLEISVAGDSLMPSHLCHLSSVLEWNGDSQRVSLLRLPGTGWLFWRQISRLP